ncbi:MAG TPA: isocitrate lyase/phosphoenolpyruvate mutase family protein [Gemmatimonadales bacterium]|nr:isocitrate lyase/phosphoenolpyruvate mutase family protein [Gemmatimonadales bacterium]
MTTPVPTLRDRLRAPAIVEAMAAHSPLSARLAEEAGFDALWASGFELSALYGVPDLSLLSMTQHLDMVRAMAEQVSLPIVADIDTGFGNALNVIHAVERYEAAGASAVVIEDKVFPKVTSLAPEGRQELVRVAEFQGKVAAAVAGRSRDEFLIIARTEALIAGMSAEEALTRARAYEEAGADLILVHAKSPTPDALERFAAAWTGRVGLVFIPTACPALTVARARALGTVRMLIYGNHAIRAAIRGMQDAFARVRRDGGIQGVGETIAPLEEVFRLQRMEVARERERRFLR